MSANSRLVLLTAGGTGGHVYPALAVANEMRKRGYSVAWMGTKQGLEGRVVPGADIPLYTLPVRGIRGKGMFGRIVGLFAVFFATLRAYVIVGRLSPDVVVGMGGYVAAPAGVAAWLLRKPLVIHEQNAVAGTTNRMLASKANVILAGFSGAFPTKHESITIGNPVREEIIEAGAALGYDYQGQRPLRLLVLGGSLGAAAINDVLPGVLRRMLRDKPGCIEVWHQSGEAHIEQVRQRYADRLKDTFRVDPFIEDMVSAYEWADLVLCRAGALTVAELALMGRPSILIPLPSAIDDHQRANAKSLSSKGAAILLQQSRLDAYLLCDILDDLIADPQRLADMSAAARKAAAPDATRQACDYCEDLMYGE